MQWVYLQCFCCLRYCYLLPAALLPVPLSLDLTKKFQMTSRFWRFCHYKVELISQGLNFFLVSFRNSMIQFFIAFFSVFLLFATCVLCFPYPKIFINPYFVDTELLPYVYWGTHFLQKQLQNLTLASNFFSSIMLQQKGAS